MPGNRLRSIHPSRRKVYEALPKSLGKKSRARIANAGVTKAERSRMSRKAARTRKRRGG